ncbi:uncharacterized protein RHO25_008473 [Cercospora beticola]|uniref:Uncharacterized protein n=1 Tax=Cercospora beticola TaxID=122368 RepID=A0ABZ0NWN8_CERBT|nr:hypothetical protein RHO25_008473 [Cercospora beticola]CAK1357399.1 unnamed protein product [Cercospora beticola]
MRSSYAFCSLTLFLGEATCKPRAKHNGRNRLSASINVRCNKAADGTQPNLSTPSFGSRGIVFTVCTEREIEAPIELVYNTTVDFHNYPAWNSFVIKVDPTPGYSLDTMPPPINTIMIFTNQGLVPGTNDTVQSTEQLSFADANVDGNSLVAISAWKSYEQAEHPNILTDLGNGRTRYVSYDSFYYDISQQSLPLKDALQRLFDQQGDELKAFVEAE